jgi:hypothetical protein
MPDLFDRLLADPVPPAVEGGIEAVLAALAASPFEDPGERAAWGGLVADRLGYAFLAGYACALARLAPGIATRAALCITEEGGGHPRAIATRIEHGPDGARLTGTKTFVTLGALAEELIVVATSGERDGRPDLRCAIVRADAPGVTLAPGPDVPFAPEIPHARLLLAHAPAARVIEGDAYLGVVKPFRTIEDLHVLVATLGWLLRVARVSGWPSATIERLAALVASGVSLAGRPPLAPGVHVALAGLFAALATLLDDGAACPWPLADAGTRALWARDRPLLSVAARAREARLEAAWRTLVGLAGEAKP